MIRPFSWPVNIYGDRRIRRQSSVGRCEIWRHYRPCNAAKSILPDCIYLIRLPTIEHTVPSSASQGSAYEVIIFATWEEGLMVRRGIRCPFGRPLIWLSRQYGWSIEKKAPEHGGCSINACEPLESSQPRFTATTESSVPPSLT